jgi:hypothetical protein
LDAVLIDSGGTDIVKLVLRRLALKLHPDAARTVPDAWRAIPPEDVRLLNRLRDLHRAGRVTIAATTTTVIITVRPPPRGSRG